MFVVRVIPKRGIPYIAPNKDVGHLHRLQRDACAMAEAKSEDDSVNRCVVESAHMTTRRFVVTYQNGKRIK